jgi:signal transduction histidine kinase/ligand-binding sensor domain-containing protein/DNA-binding NarL/FixJ family response regulator
MLLLLPLLFFTIVFFPLNVHAQKNEPTFEKVSIEIDGEEVFDAEVITQDHEGYMWMQTNLGLIRFDGLKGKKYELTRNETSSIPIEYVSALYTDSLGELWIGANSGLSKYDSDCDCLQQYSFGDDKNKLTYVQSITEDLNKNIWIGTSKGNLFRYERKRNSFERVLHGQSDSLPIAYDGIWHLLADQNNRLWIGTNSGLVRYDVHSGEIKQFLHHPSDPNSLIDNRISALYEDQQGEIFIGTFKSGFLKYNPKNESLYRISINSNNPEQVHASYSKETVFGDDPHVNLIHQDQKGNYWIGTTGKGVNYFNTNAGSVTNYNFDLVNPQILGSIFEDKQGNIWIGSVMGGGLYKTDLFARKYHVNTSIPNVEAVYESALATGILWVSSQEYGLRKINLKTNKTISYVHDEDNSKSIGHTWVRSVYQENNKTLWVGLGNGGPYGGQVGDGGIGRMDIETGTFTNFKLLRNDDGLGDFSYTVYSICEDKEGYLWLGTGPGGIFRSDKEKTEFKVFKNFKNDNQSEDIFLNISRIDANGDVWASDFGGEGTLYLYDRKENTFKPYLEGFIMYDLLIDEKGWILISTWKKGLLHLNPADKAYDHYTKKKGLPSNDVVSIVPGENGIYWLNTRLGPAKFNVNSTKISSVGLPKIRYNRGILKASDGKIYLSANNGLSSFYPSEIDGNPYPPQLVISDLMVSDSSFLDGENRFNELTLTHDQNDISLKYIGLHFSDPENNEYKYKLGPMDSEWIKAGNLRSVRFPNLSPGIYNFQLKGSNSDGVWSDKIASLQFTITQPWWATWWSYVLYFVAIAFITYRIYHFQLSKKIAVSESKRLKEVNQFKNTLFTNITHEFRTPLTVIKGMADSIKSKLENEQYDNLDTSLEMIDRNSDGMLHLVNQMLDLAKLESGNIELQLVQADVIPFLKYVSESFSSYAEENQISLTIYSEIDSLVMDFDANKLTSIISNLLSNAIKFTPELGKIIVHINQVKAHDKDCLLIKVKDTGMGIAEEELSNIFSRFYQTDASSVRESGGTGIGLALTKELVGLMNGAIEAKSAIDKGSEFSVIIPVSKNASKSKIVQANNVPQSPILKAPKYPEPSSAVNAELPLALIIEDNLDVAHYLKTCLTNKYETMHAVNGIAGIELAFEKIPDIIICDVMMPGKDGFEVCETLKTDKRTDHIPIVILTAKVTVQDRITGLSHGADAYLAKPFNKEELFIRLDQLISIRTKLIRKIQQEGITGLLKKHKKNPKLQFLQKVEKLILDEIDNASFGSGELAKKLLISDSQLYRKVKAITGKSTAIFMRSIRLQKAKEILRITDKTVSEVAYETGFNDPSWFSRAYKDEFGFSPSETPK